MKLYLARAVEDKYLEHYVIGVFSTRELAERAVEENHISNPVDWFVPIMEIELDEKIYQ